MTAIRVQNKLAVGMIRQTGSGANALSQFHHGLSFRFAGRSLAMIVLSSRTARRSAAGIPFISIISVQIDAVDIIGVTARALTPHAVLSEDDIRTVNVEHRYKPKLPL